MNFSNMTDTVQMKEVVMTCLERLQKEAVICLESFPDKITDLNSIIEIYAPSSIKTGSTDAHTINRMPECRSISSTIGEYDTASAADTNRKLLKSKFDVTSLSSYYTKSSYERKRSNKHHGINKRRYYRIYRNNNSNNGVINRRRSSALGHMLAFIARKFVICTKSMIITPSCYLVERFISMIFQRRELKNAQCGPCADWSNSLSSCVTSLKEDKTLVGNFISVMRPVAVQLISDTTTLKRWLQTLATSSTKISLELANATRNTETIDCWAYELFFHLKYLQVNRAREADKITTTDEKTGSAEEVTHMNLWHRMVQLRDNYIILYENLYANPKVQHVKTNVE